MRFLVSAVEGFALTFVVRALEVDFVANFRVFWWPDEFDTSIFAVF